MAEHSRVLAGWVSDYLALETKFAIALGASMLI